MSDSDSDELSVPGFSDMEPEHAGTSSVDSNQRLGVNVCPHFVDPNPEPSSSNIGCSPPTWSVHYKDNRSGHILAEEAESCKGEEFFEFPLLMTPRRNTPPTLLCHRRWAMGRGRRLRLEGSKNSSFIAYTLKKKEQLLDNMTGVCLI